MTNLNPNPNYEFVLDIIVDAPIRWTLGYDNSPDVTLVSRDDLSLYSHGWTPVYDYDPQHNMYIAVSGDGRYETYHAGAARWSNTSHRFETPKTEGFAGREFELLMADGHKVTLQGAWHGMAPPELEIYDMSCNNQVNLARGGCYTFGLKLDYALVEAIMQKFHPEIEYTWRPLGKYKTLFIDKTQCPTDVRDAFLKKFPDKRGFVESRGW